MHPPTHDEEEELQEEAVVDVLDEVLCTGEDLGIAPGHRQNADGLETAKPPTAKPP